MDFESTNGCHQYDDGLLASNRSDATPSPDKMHVDFNKATVDVHHHDPMHDANDFYFGKNGDAEYHGNINTIPSSITSNGDGGDKLSTNELNVGRSIDDDHDDFGPETDVDATDDNAISPLSPSVSSVAVIDFMYCSFVRRIVDVLTSDIFRFPFNFYSSQFNDSSCWQDHQLVGFFHLRFVWSLAAQCQTVCMRFTLQRVLFELEPEPEVLFIAKTSATFVYFRL